METRLRQLEEARISCDVGRMLFLVRTALSRDLGNMSNLKLYKHSHIGTKDLIDRYISTALDTLTTLLDVSGKSRCDGPESKYILEQLLASRQAFGRSALLLSGGATFGMNHVGVLKALWEAGLLPRIISGASAGSIVCAVLCTHTDDELPEILTNFGYGDLAVFEEEGKEDTLLIRAARFLKFGALFDISHLTRVMKDLLGDMTFQEAYNRTRRILNICVSSASIYELPRLLNYITAPNVLIWSAVAASCSVPLIFSASSLLVKDPKTGAPVPWNPSPQRWIDGSVDNDLPMTRLAEMFNVNHFIVSQVNPHVVPFLLKEEEYLNAEAQREPATNPGLLHTVTGLARDEALHRMQVLAEFGILPNTLSKVISVLSQKYSGDINIFPEISYADFPRMLKNPTTEFMFHASLCGERATWPKLSRIRNHCALELALDDAVQKLRTRVHFSPSRVNSRLNTMSDLTGRSVESGRGRGISGVRRRKSQSSDPDRIQAEQDQETQRSASRLRRARSTGAAVKTIHAMSSSHDPIPLQQVLRNVRDEVKASARAPDFTSSADTSWENDSDSDDELSISSTETLSSPPMHGWPSENGLYFSRSQPNSPLASSRPRPEFPPLSTTISAPIPGATSTSPTASAKSLNMTPTAKTLPNSPEHQYKRFPHGGYSGHVSRTSDPIAYDATDKYPVAELDISGTKGLLLRKKSSASLNRQTSHTSFDDRW